MDASTILVSICVAVAGLAVVGVVVLAGTSDKRTARHPDGRRGLVRDQILVLTPLLTFVVMLILKTFTTLDESPLWIWSWGVVLIATFAFMWLPAVKRARDRLSATHRYPSQ